MYITELDNIKRKLRVAAEENMSKLLKHLIESDVASQEKKDMEGGVNYYECKHDILNREIKYFDGSGMKVDQYAANNRVQHPFHRNLVDQKIDRVLGEDLTFKCDNETQLNEMIETLGEERLEKLQDLGVNVSNKGREWIHVLINEAGEFEWLIMDARECIPIFETKFEKKLVGMIRYYRVTEVDEKGSETKHYKVEWWDEKKVTYYYEYKDGAYEKDTAEPINPRYHWYFYNTDNPDKLEAESWGVVPFIEISNNRSKLSDLNFIKSLIDDYDLVDSDWSNNLMDIQEIIWKLYGYEGENLSAFMKDLKRYKAITLSSKAEGGDAEAETNEVPTESRDKRLDRLERDIHLFGRGVGNRSDVIGQNPSGVAFKFLFIWYDLKCKAIKSYLTKGLKKLFWFEAEYMSKFKKKNYDPRNITWVYNETMIINESEDINNFVNSQGFLDQETLLQHHPWVNDVAEVMKKFKKEKEERIKNMERIMIPDDKEE